MKTKEEIIDLNKKQKEFYNTKNKNLPTLIWSNVRGGLLNRIRKDIGIHEQTYDLHKVWFGDLSNKKVLDLGCFEGNNLSLHLAQNAKEYLGIDLSDVAVEKLNKRLESIPTASAEAVDFLSNSFKEKEFDLIYAYGVLHHFQNVDILVAKLKEKLTDDGEIISYDPLRTSIPIKILRTLYRPFQSDADWEWPFSKKTYYKFQDNFDVLERRGVLGKSKWFFLLNCLALSEAKKREIGQKWHKEDWNESLISDSKMFQCMHLTMRMKRK